MEQFYSKQITFDLINPKEDFVKKKLKIPQLTLPKSNKMATRYSTPIGVLIRNNFRKNVSKKVKSSS
jgi:hypothetical protein